MGPNIQVQEKKGQDTKHNFFRAKEIILSIELHSPTNSIQKLKLMGRGGQFTYTSTMLITTPELKSLLSQANTATKDTATAEISLLFNLTSLIHLMCLKELLPT